jgi:hypothetical protein
MIKISSNIGDTTVRLGAWVSKVGGAGRKLLFSVASNAVAILVRSHLLRLGSWKHQSAAQLNAQPTGFLQKAARGTVFNASENGGEVIIPAPLGRAFHDVEIRPKSAAALTIPASAEAYGKRASVLAALGWKIFRPKGERFLMGAKKGEDPKILYWLTASVKQKQDRELLPSDDELKITAAAAMMAEIRRIAS